MEIKTTTLGHYPDILTSFRDIIAARFKRDLDEGTKFFSKGVQLYTATDILVAISKYGCVTYESKNGRGEIWEG